MFSKEEIALAKATVEAIKEITERQRRKCPECKGTGKTPRDKYGPSEAYRYDSPCHICNGTGKEKWKWEPRSGEWFISPMGHLHLVPDYEETSPDCEEPSRDYKQKRIPLLHWEDRLEPRLKEMGYHLLVNVGELGKKCLATIDEPRRWLANGEGKTRQEAVMRAVINLKEHT